MKSQSLKRFSLCLIVLMVLLVILTNGATAASKKPNILYILADDLGYADVSANEWSKLEFKTPHIDSIFTSGVRFRAGYVSNSVCAPSRAGLLTGRSGSRFGFESNLPEEQWDSGSFVGLDPDQKTIPDILAAVGYKSFGLGKWHLGGNTALFHPNLRGFDEWYGFLGGSRTYFQQATYDQADSIEHNGTYVSEPADMYTTDFLTDKALDYITEQTTNNPGQPWFMYLSYNAPHGPMHAKRSDINRVPLASHHSSSLSRAKRYTVMETDGSVVLYSTTDKNILRRVYGAMVVNMDDNIGRVLDKLDALGITDNTLIVFHSDNGGPESDNWSINDPLRGGKGSLWEGGIRVPFAVCWPGGIPGGKVFGHDCPISSLDMMPTFAAVSGADKVQYLRTDGINLMPLLTNQVSTMAPRQIYWRRGGTSKIAIRSGDWKYYYDRKTGDTYLFHQDSGSDEGNSANMAKSKPEILACLQTEYATYENTLADPHWGVGVAIITYDLDDAVRGMPYSMPLQYNEELQGGPVTWSISAGKPDWLKIDPVTGVISGTPPLTAADTYTIQLRIANTAGETSTYKVSLNVKDVKTNPARQLDNTDEFSQDAKIAP